MADKQSSAKKKVTLRKYPNRRYYDTSRSRYVTLEEIYALIREGHDVEVCDSKTGEDITVKVLAQIILEHDSPKLGIFPVPLLHQLIRTNEPLVRDFVDKYFNQALTAFLQSQRQFERFLRQSLGLHAPLPLGQDWARVMMAPFMQGFYNAGGAEANGGDSSAPARDSSGTELHQLVLQLQQQVNRLQQQLEQRESS